MGLTINKDTRIPRRAIKCVVKHLRGMQPSILRNNMIEACEHFFQLHQKRPTQIIVNPICEEITRVLIQGLTDPLMIGTTHAVEVYEFVLGVEDTPPVASKIGVLTKLTKRPPKPTKIAA